MKCSITTILFFCSFLQANGQQIANSSTIPSISNDKYFKFNYDNDFFTAADYYYSQGINLEFVHPSLKESPLTKILLIENKNITRYGISIEHNVYTPSSIRHDEILYNDRPFAAGLMLISFSISLDTNNNSRINSSLSLGAIGPVAFGEEMQTSIHKWLNNLLPLGWNHQIRNDIIINYEAGQEKQLIRKRNFLVNSNLQLSAGTLNDKATIGFTLTAGIFDSPFEQTGNKPKHIFSAYIYTQPLVNFIGYDATMQGGLFNRSSEYALDKNQISRVVLQNNFGIAFNYKKIGIEYYQSIITKEFKSGTGHRWGGIKIGLVF